MAYQTTQVSTVNGRFGRVTLDGKKRSDAKKRTKSNPKSGSARAAFKRTQPEPEDMSLLLKLRHPNIVEMIERKGKLRGSKYVKIDNGKKVCFQQYLLCNDTTENLLVNWCHDICKGMEFLHSKNILHCGLSTRNAFLYEDENVVKITYLKTAIQVKRGVATYKSGPDEPEPRKLERFPAAKESLVDGKFTKVSDVWAFGMTMLEIFDSGLNPFRGKKRKMVSKWIIDGNCPLSLVQVDISHDILMFAIKPALRVTPELRHSFSTLSESFTGLRRKNFPSEVVAGKTKIQQKTKSVPVPSKHGIEESEFAEVPIQKNVGFWRRILKYFFRKRVFPN